MATVRNEGGASVDFLIDENGQRIEVPENATLETTHDVEAAVGATGPANWWRYGLLTIAAIVVVLFVMQMFGGGAPSTDVVPGTPVAAPANETPA